jgi:Tfp pilus assembly protein PilN
MSARRTVDINLATTPFYNNTLLYSGYAAFLFVVVLFTWYNASTWMKQNERIAELNEQLASGREKMARIRKDADESQREIDSKNLKTLKEQVQAANGILQERNLSWTKLLNDLEAVEPYKVKFTDMRPTSTPLGMQIEVRGVAHDLENIWLMQQHLLDDPKFPEVYPAAWSHTVDGGEYVFTVRFNYQANPKAPEEAAPALPAAAKKPAKEPPPASEDAEIGAAGAN